MNRERNTKRPINDYKDFMKFKVNLKDFDDTYVKNGGGCPCSNGILKGGSFASASVVDMNSFLNMYLPSLKGGYKKKRFQRKLKGGYATQVYGDADLQDFNLFRDVMTVNSDGFIASTNILTDLTPKTFNYPSAEQTVSRALF